VTAPAAEALGRLLAAMRDALCEQTGADPALTWIGPVDFGNDAREPHVTDDPASMGR
jgi:hypothetical protein